MSGPTWVSCSPRAVEGCGCQDLRGCQAVNPLRPRSLTCPPPAPRIHLDMGSVYPPRALAACSFAAQGIPSPSQLGARRPRWQPQKKARETFRLIAWRSAAQRRLKCGVCNNGLTVTPGRQQICIFTEASGGHKA